MKTSQACPNCGAEAWPWEESVKLDAGTREVYVKYWGYTCPTCAWTWANAAQRKHNERELRKTARRARVRL